MYILGMLRLWLLRILLLFVMCTGFGIARRVAILRGLKEAGIAVFPVKKFTRGEALTRLLQRSKVMYSSNACRSMHNCHARDYHIQIVLVLRTFDSEGEFKMSRLLVAFGHQS